MLATLAQPRLDWALHGRDRPYREASRFVQADGLRWHVQWLGHRSGRPVALLLHGTGASTHSWRGLMPLLAPHFSVLAVDLPGHAFTEMPADPQRLGLRGMAHGVAALLRELGVAPALIVGHSAGAAIGVQMCLDGLAAPRALIAINGALLPLAGLAGTLFSPVARLLVRQPWVPRLFAARAARPQVIDRLLEGTGSHLDAQGRALYAGLVDNPGHVAGALGMMAQWDLRELARRLPSLATPLHLIAATNDRTLPPEQARQVHERVPGSTLTTLPGLGHLAHEEDPAAVARIVEHVLSDT